MTVLVYKGLCNSYMYAETNTVNSEIFVIILFSEIALKDILAGLKIRN